MATLVPPVDRSQQARVRLEQLAKSAVIGDVISPIEEPWDALVRESANASDDPFIRIGL